MIIGAIFIPTQLSDLLAMIRNSSKFTKPYQFTDNTRHVLVVGNLEIVALKGFLREFFSPDHGNGTMIMTVVLLARDEPNEELLALLADPVYSNRVKYIKGSPISFRSLQKARADVACASFILASRISDISPVEEDAKTLFIDKSIRKFNKKIKIYAQILLPRNKIHLEGLGNVKLNVADHVLCIDEFKLGMAAQSCLAPGFCNLMYLLTNSICTDTIGGLEDFQDGLWIKEYLEGAMMELYEIKLSLEFSNLRFEEIIVPLYQKHRTIVFAIGLDIDHDQTGTFGSNQRILFNPTNLVLKGGETLFMIADSDQTTKIIEKLHMHDILNVENNEQFWVPERVRYYFENTTRHSIPRMYRELKCSETDSLEKIPSVTGKLKKGKTDDFTVVNRQSGTNKVESEAPTAAEIFGTPLSSFSSSEDELKTPRAAVGSSTSTAIKLEQVVSVLEAVEKLEYIPGKSLPEKVRDHVVYCCINPVFPINLAYFVAPFRQKEPNSPIVILCPSPPEDDDWKVLSDYSNIYYIVGTPLLRKDLRKTGIDKALSAVIFSDPQPDSVTDRSADATSLLALLNIQALTSESRIFITVEFIHDQNMKFIGHSKQSYRAAAISDVTEFQSQNLIPAFAGGHVFSQSMFHSVLCQAYYEHNLLSVLQHEPGLFFQIALPDKMIGLPFGTLIAYLCSEYRCITIGLYRVCNIGKTFQYVFLNPKPSSIIQEGDSAFLIGPRKPEW
ncbi:erg10, acetyl-CoA C-acetyltransferase [Boothiomyces sp. JEL0838]|nr:erg10, acetyl-CoA C-acetyltransferase [Boothiomyces sp. JEL0838]KAJ3313153.1 erg10, acetyl-CoA C-acetyltransferase [Boothiomyces sp. JEL0838]